MMIYPEDPGIMDMKRLSLAGMARILLKCQRDDSDIKEYDIETLMIEILRKTIKMRNEINVLKWILKI